MKPSQFAKKNWYMQGCLGVPAYAGIPLRAISFLLGKGCTLDTYRGESNKSYFDSDKELLLAKEHISRQLNNITYIDQKYNSWKSISEKILNIIKSSKKQDIKKNIDIILPLLFESWKIAWMIEFFDLHGDKFLNENVKLAEKQKAALFVPSDLTNIQKQRIDLLKMSLGEPDSNEILAHEKTYYFVLVSYSDGHPYTNEMIRKTLDYEKTLPVNARSDEIKKITLLHSQSLKKRDEIFSKLSGNERNIVYFFQRIIDWREERKEFVQKVNNFVHNFLVELEKENGIPLDLLRFVNLYNYKNELSLALLEERSRFCAATLGDNGDVTYLIGSEAACIVEFVEHNFYSGKDEVRGKSASKGMSSGIVKLIMKQSDFDHFNQGDILVTAMTRPEFLPIMKKAAAIVTDEGGITCHAAIVARELNIPCIIGTQVATKVLKDGDFVDVDADKGVVRKINKPNRS